MCNPHILETRYCDHLYVCTNIEHGHSKSSDQLDYNPGQNVLGHLRKLGTKTHFAKLTHILPLENAWGCCYKGLFLLSPSPPSSVDCVELKLEYITSTLHRGGRGEGRCLNLRSYYVSVPRVLTRVVGSVTAMMRDLCLFSCNVIYIFKMKCI